MKLTKDIAAEILTGLHNDTFEQYADEPAKEDEDFQEMVDAIADLVDVNGYDMVTALAQYISDSSEYVRAHELKDFAQEHFRGSGSRVGDVLKEYAQNSEMGPLHDLFTALDKAGAVDWLDWNDYADSGQSPLEGLNFVLVPAVGPGAHTVFLFTD